MKILSLNYEYPPLGGGAGVLSEDLNRHLAAAGHQVTVVTMHYPGLPAHEIADGVEIFRIPCIRRHKASCAPWEQLSYLRSLRTFMRSHARLQAYDVCHAHFIVPTGVGALHIRRKYGMPYILTAHGSDVEGHNDKKSVQWIHSLIRRPWRRIVKESCAVVSPSVMLKELMVKNYLSDRYRVIPNGLAAEDFPGAAEKQPVILITGRMQESKNMQTVLKALRACDLRGWQVELIGDGPYRAKLEGLAGRLGMRDKVHFRGWLPHGSALQRELTGNAAVFVSASRYENCPMAVLEAAAAGSTLLLSDIPGHRSLLGDQARYFPSDDAEELAGLLKRAMAGDRRRREYDIRAFSWEQVIPAYEELLRAAAGSAKH